MDEICVKGKSLLFLRGDFDDCQSEGDTSTVFGILLTSYTVFDSANIVLKTPP